MTLTLGKIISWEGLNVCMNSIYCTMAAHKGDDNTFSGLTDRGVKTRNSCSETNTKAALRDRQPAISLLIFDEN